jgi:hypothetical protein
LITYIEVIGLKAEERRDEGVGILGLSGVAALVLASAWFGTGGAMVSYVPAVEGNDLL